MCNQYSENTVTNTTFCATILVQTTVSTKMHVIVPMIVHRRVHKVTLIIQTEVHVMVPVKLHKNTKHMCNVHVIVGTHVHVVIVQIQVHVVIVQTQVHVMIV